MAIKVIDPSGYEKYVNEHGQLTLEGLRLLQLIVKMLRDHEDRIVTLEP